MSAMSTPEQLILLIERAGKPEHTFAPPLTQKGYRLHVAASGQGALASLGKEQPSIIILNSASLGSSGLRIVRQLQDAAPKVPLIHIVADGAFGEEDEMLAEVTLVMPFTARKLINSLKRLIPEGRDEMIEVGPIRLAPKAQIAQSYGREKRLTAKTTSLLSLFMEHPGEILDRGYLMRQVWETDYMGDTRTLDVHIRWVREAIEKNPQSPRHIVTVRGKGYRFDPMPIPHHE